MRTPRPSFRSCGSAGPGVAKLPWVVLMLLAMLLGACMTARMRAEAFPPVVCSVEDAGGTEHLASVEVDGASATVQSGDLTFGVDYRSHPDGRILETTIRRSSGEVIERVGYLVPGRALLRNQFGPERAQLTGSHEIAPEGTDRLRWSCAVGSRGGPAEDR